MKTIAEQNSERLAHLSVLFCKMNGIDANMEVVPALADCIMGGIAKWYAENGRTDFNPRTELIADDAIVSAFARAQEIVILATISAQTGVGMDWED